MLRLPKMVVIGHRTWKIKRFPKAKPHNRKRDGLCEYKTTTIWVRLDGPSAAEQANTMFHEIMHAIWNESGLTHKDGEERIVTVTANVLTQVVRDNPRVFDWIAEKARS